jgi:hypothetical protein
MSDQLRDYSLDILLMAFIFPSYDLNVYNSISPFETLNNFFSAKKKY